MHTGRAAAMRCRYRNAELQNGRWAMLGVAGIVIPAVRSSRHLCRVWQTEWHGVPHQQQLRGTGHDRRWRCAPAPPNCRS